MNDRIPEIVSFLKIPDFLPDALYEEALAWAIANERAFRKSDVGTDEKEWRSSRVINTHGVMPFESTVRKAIYFHLPQVFRALSLRPFRPSTAEVQLTASMDGDYYRPHNDNGLPDVAPRQITFVIYLVNLPNSFEGGELRVFDGYRLRSGSGVTGVYRDDASFLDVKPEPNLAVFFQSGAWHEVRPTRVPSRQWADSRFTLNGWVRA